MSIPTINVINLFLGLAAWISSLIIIYSGIKYLLVRRDKNKKIKAGKMFIYSLVILIISVFLYAILLPPSVPPLSL